MASTVNWRDKPVKFLDGVIILITHSIVFSMRCGLSLSHRALLGSTIQYSVGLRLGLQFSVLTWERKHKLLVEEGITEASLERTAQY